MENTAKLFDRHNEFLKKLLLPVPEEPIEGNSMTNVHDEAFNQPIKNDTTGRNSETPNH